MGQRVCPMPVVADDFGDVSSDLVVVPTEGMVHH